MYEPDDPGDASVWRKNATDLIKASQDVVGARLIREAFTEFDTRRKGISSLANLVVRFYNGLPAPEVEESVKRLGWALLPGH